MVPFDMLGMVSYSCTDQPTDRRTDGRTDTGRQQGPRLRIASRVKNLQLQRHSL